jgi:flavin reductase (DIM6/NTAB) family NADH-FMN oxidoreductase RutF
MDELPEWPEGTVAVLSTGGGEPHAIPVSTAARRGPHVLAFALAHSRRSLTRLRKEPACALTIIAADLAFTAVGRAVVEAEHEKVAVVRMTVDGIQDHMRPTFAVQEGVRWDWTDESAAAADAEVRALVGTERARSAPGP